MTLRAGPRRSRALSPRGRAPSVRRDHSLNILPVPHLRQRADQGGARGPPAVAQVLRQPGIRVLGPGHPELPQLDRFEDVPGLILVERRDVIPMLVGDDQEVDPAAGGRLDILDDAADPRHVARFGRAVVDAAVDEHVERVTGPPGMGFAPGESEQEAIAQPGAIHADRDARRRRLHAAAARRGPDRIRRQRRRVSPRRGFGPPGPGVLRRVPPSRSRGGFAGFGFFFAIAVGSWAGVVSP